MTNREGIAPTRGMLGRRSKFWFVFTPAADAARYAALLTMALNCALCRANAFDYFTWLFDRLAEGVLAKNALDVMPQAWLRSQQDSQRDVA